MSCYTVANRVIFRSAAHYLLRDAGALSTTMRRFNALSPNWRHIDEEKALDLLIQGLHQSEPDKPHAWAVEKVRLHVQKLVRPSPSKRAQRAAL